MRVVSDRFGMGWRPELAGALLAPDARIDVVEVIADDWLEAPERSLRALDLLATQRPILLHGVSLGLASVEPVESRRVERLARLVARVAPERWSEHLAFVRGGGVELGHLAAPPRRDSILAGLARNVERVRRVVGAAPLLENVATLVDPPGSDRDDATFVAQALQGCGSGLLLDLHNLLANAVNLGFDPMRWLDAVPLGRVEQIHLAGGRRVAHQGVVRILDDHRHDVPDPVFDLLEEVGARASQPLTVLLERDGDFPSLAHLLADLDRARAALQRGRARASPTAAAAGHAQRSGFATAATMASTEPGLNAWLANVYVDAAARAELIDRGTAPPGLGAQPIDRIGIAMAAESFARKRAEARSGGGQGASRTTRQPPASRSQRNRSWSRLSRPCQNSIARGVSQ